MRKPCEQLEYLHYAYDNLEISLHQKNHCETWLKQSPDSPFMDKLCDLQK